jgi:two-component system, chemotaxis family, chemotaxis protein CheY
MAVDKSTPILVVDDYRTMIRIVRNLLHQLGFEDVDDASDGASALAKLRARRFGLVISDWMMEPMSGIELLRQVRADPKLQALPFIMITAENRKDRVAEAERAGADAYVVKPFNAEVLSERIAAVMRH